MLHHQKGQITPTILLIFLPEVVGSRGMSASALNMCSLLLPRSMCTNTKLYKALPHLVSVTVINSLMSASATDPPSLSRPGRGQGWGWLRLTVSTVHLAALDDLARWWRSPSLCSGWCPPHELHFYMKKRKVCMNALLRDYLI